ncbi:MAG: hypothetical protein JO043_01910 [Candidatus Eremiobacteraeota bacterium]|nr:hypothetical protein [Candidatus Eremiobacteraeota bacterium]
MFGNIENMISQVTGGQVDPQQLEQAASEHVSEMDSGELANHLQNAADTANQNGNPQVAQDLMNMVQQHRVDPDSLKNAAVQYLRDNPGVLSHFAPPFAQGILSKVL